MAKKRRPKQGNAEVAFRRLRGFRGWSRGPASRGKIYTPEEIEAFAADNGFAVSASRREGESRV